MPRRAASPALSENEVDILGSLYTEDFENANGIGHDETGEAPDLDLGGILDAPDGSEDDGEGDEAFIALKQAASFRKSSNLKGKSVKKGGGFQAMGPFPRRDCFGAPSLTSKRTQCAFVESYY